MLKLPPSRPQMHGAGGSVVRLAGILWAALDDGGDLGRVDAVEMQVQAARKFTTRWGGQFGVSPRLREWRGGPHQRGNARGPGAGRVQLPVGVVPAPVRAAVTVQWPPGRAVVHPAWTCSPRARPPWR